MFLSCIAAALLVPTIWIVDANNGPGAHFTDLPAAVAAAQSGDTLIVRAGGYTPFAVSGKALTIRGVGSSGLEQTSVLTAVGAPPTVGVTRIENVPQGQTFFIDGVNFRPGLSLATFGSMLEVVGSSTEVVLADCEVSGYVGNNGDALVVDGSAVHAFRSKLSGGNRGASQFSGGFGGDGASVRNGGVLTADSCQFFGGFGGNLVPGSIAGDGVRVESSRAELHRSSCTAGASVSAIGTTSGASGIGAYSGSTVDVFGSSANVMQGGIVPVAIGVVGGAGLRADATSAVDVYGDVTILGGAQGGVVTPGLVVGPVTIGLPAAPTIDTSGVAAPAGELYAGNPVTVSVGSNLAGASYVLAVSFATGYVDFASSSILGGAIVDFTTAGFVTGVLDATGGASFGFIPLLTPGLTAIPVYAQVAVLDTNGVVRLSNCDARVFRIL